MRLLFLVLALSSQLSALSFADESKVSLQHYLQGVLYEQQGNYAQALKEYESVVILDPAAGYVYKRQAELALELGDPDKALAAAEQALKLEPPSAPNWRLMGNVRWARGEVGPAKEAFRKALDLDPRFSEALLSLANLTAAADPEEAKGYFQKYLELEPENAAEALYQIALLEERQGHLETAGQRLQEAVARDPDSLQARYALAQLFEVRQDTRAALAEYREILGRETKNPGLWVRVGEIHSLLGERADADAAFRRAKDLQKDHPGACFWLAVLAEERGDYAAAAAALADSAQLASDPKLNLRLGYYLTQSGRLGDAVTLIEGAWKKWPKNAEVGYFLALGLDDLGQPVKAVSVLEPVAALDPGSRDVRFQLAALYEKLDRLADSEREFRVLLSSHPNDAQALNYLGYSLADRGRDLPEALGLIERAVALEPKNGAYLDSLGWAHFKLGRSSEALSELKASLAILSDDDAVWDHLGDVYAALKDSGTAWTCWKRSLQLKPANRKVADKLAAVEAGMSGEELGWRLLAFLRSSEGAVRTLFGSCTVSGKVAGRSVSVNALVHYERALSTDSAAPAPAAGTVRFEMLGPMFLPVWRAYLGPQGEFEMDPLELAGIPPENLAAAVSGALRVLRDHWTGALFAQAGQYRRGWSRKWIETPAHSLFLSENNLYLKSAESRSPGLTVAYRNFQNVKGHPLARVYEIEGPGYRVRIQLDQLGADFLDTPPTLP